MLLVPISSGPTGPSVQGGQALPENQNQARVEAHGAVCAVSKYSMLPAFVPPPPPYPYLTAVRGYAPPDDLRIESLGRPPTCFGPRSYKSTPKDRIAVMNRHYIQPSASAGRLNGSTVRLESLPARETEWREGFIKRKATCEPTSPPLIIISAPHFRAS